METRKVHAIRVEGLSNKLRGDVIREGHRHGNGKREERSETDDPFSYHHAFFYKTGVFLLAQE
jgi:hypothetical protein